VSPPQPRSPQRETHSDAQARAALGALVRANLRFWATVAPVVRRELASWEGPARAIEDPRLRDLAEQKLREERFNAEVAATLATLAPRATRTNATRAVVALELLFDYLDGRTELPAADPLAEGERLYAPLLATLEDGGEPVAHALRHVGARSPGGEADEHYMWALSERTRTALASLPSIAAVRDVAHEALARCAVAQTRLHATAALGEAQLRDWATECGASSGLSWREFTGGCASSVLAVHALICAAGDPSTSPEDARAIDAAYLAMGGVITTLDSLVDEREDHARGQRGFVGLFHSREELSRSLLALTREAHSRARAAPNGPHHVMTLGGVIAYYTTHPGAREDSARSIAAQLRRELSPTIWPTLAVMSAWRAAKRARATLRAVLGGQPAPPRSPST
jgi:hypothetical protein